MAKRKAELEGRLEILKSETRRKYSKLFNKYDIALCNVDKLAKEIKEDQKTISQALNLFITETEFLLKSCHLLRKMYNVMRWMKVYCFYNDYKVSHDILDFHEENLEIYTMELQNLFDTNYKTMKSNLDQENFKNFKTNLLSVAYKCEQV